MGVKTIDSDGGFAKFGKGDNAYLKPTKIDKSYNDYQDHYQLEFQFLGVSTEGGQPGTVPGYLSSKITIQDDDNFSSNLGKLLVAANKLEAVLSDLGVPEETIQAIRDGDKRYEAETEEENADLWETVMEHLSDVEDFVVKGGTILAGEDNDYSKVNEIYERVDKNPFSDDPADSTTSEESDTEAADAEDDATALA